MKEESLVILMWNNNTVVTEKDTQASRSGQRAKLLNYGHVKVTSPTYIGVKKMFACTAQDLAT